MERLFLALLCFWRILIGEPLPVERLPQWAFPLPPPPIPLPISGRLKVVKEEDVKAAPRPPEKKHSGRQKEAPKPEPRAEAPKPSEKDNERSREEGALVLLSLLQREGRLLDFLMEKIDGYQDAQVGAAVRAIHAGCKKAIVEHVTLEPVLKGAEESPVTLESDYDQRAVKLTGNVRGKPPFKGTLKHHGWRAKQPKGFGAVAGDPTVVAQAEVEL
jgi:hypothetical protein